MHLGMLSHSHTLEGTEYDSCVSQEVCIVLSHSEGFVLLAGTRGAIRAASFPLEPFSLLLNL